jgi:hypothetical protein
VSGCTRAVGVITRQFGHGGFLIGAAQDQSQFFLLAAPIALMWLTASQTSRQPGDAITAVAFAPTLPLCRRSTAEIRRIARTGVSLTKT